MTLGLLEKRNAVNINRNSGSACVVLGERVLGEGEVKICGRGPGREGKEERSKWFAPRDLGAGAGEQRERP